MDNGHVMRAFFKNSIPNNWPILVNGPNELWGYYQVKYQHTFRHFVSLVHDFQLVLQKTKILRHFKGIYVWDWDMNLGCKELDTLSHHVFVVYVLTAPYARRICVLT